MPVLKVRQHFALHQIADRLRGIGQLFDDTTHEERRLPINQRHGTTMVLAVRQWGFSAFRDFERESVNRAPKN